MLDTQEVTGSSPVSPNYRKSFPAKELRQVRSLRKPLEIGLNRRLVSEWCLPDEIQQSPPRAAPEARAESGWRGLTFVSPISGQLSTFGSAARIPCQTQEMPRTSVVCILLIGHRRMTRSQYPQYGEKNSVGRIKTLYRMTFSGWRWTGMFV